MSCEKCSSGFIRKDEDLWEPCECLVVSKYEDMKLGGICRDEVTKYPAGDFVIVGEVSKAYGVANQVIWDSLHAGADTIAGFSFSGDISGRYLTNTHDEPFLRGFEEASLLFIHLITGEAHGKLTGTVVNSVYEFRKALGMRTIFMTPYGGLRLWKRYPPEESDFGIMLKSLEMVCV